MKIVIPSTIAAKLLGIPTKLLSQLTSGKKHRISASMDDEIDYYSARGIEKLVKDAAYRRELLCVPGWHLTNPFSSEQIWIEIKEHSSFELNYLD